jgi:hypothetical protein
MTEKYKVELFINEKYGGSYALYGKELVKELHYINKNSDRLIEFGLSSDAYPFSLKTNTNIVESFCEMLYEIL